MNNQDKLNRLIELIPIEKLLEPETLGYIKDLRKAFRKKAANRPKINIWNGKITRHQVDLAYSFVKEKKIKSPMQTAFEMVALHYGGQSTHSLKRFYDYQRSRRPISKDELNYLNDHRWSENYLNRLLNKALKNRS